MSWVSAAVSAAIAVGSRRAPTFSSTTAGESARSEDERRRSGDKTKRTTSTYGNTVDTPSSFDYATSSSSSYSTSSGFSSDNDSSSSASSYSGGGGSFDGGGSSGGLVKDALATLPVHPTRQHVERLEENMRELPQVELAVEHGFGPGFYARSLLIPKDTLLTGKVHATDHIFMVTAGDITLTTDDGVMRVQAPYQAICKAGGKRAGYAHADTICVNIHITTETDLAQLESDLIAAPALAAPITKKEIL